MPYIDRDALIDRVTRMWESRQLTNTKYKCFTEILTAEPTADVVESKKGKWKQGLCSECGYNWDAPISSVPNYCPNCGSYNGKETRG